jgi:hypothetical protein
MRLMWRLLWRRRFRNQRYVVLKCSCDIVSRRLAFAGFKVIAIARLANGTQFISVENIEQLCPYGIGQTVAVQVGNWSSIGNTLANDCADGFGLLVRSYIAGGFALTGNAGAMVALVTANGLIWSGGWG